MSAKDVLWPDIHGKCYSSIAVELWSSSSLVCCRREMERMENTSTYSEKLLHFIFMAVHVVNFN